MDRSRLPEAMQRRMAERDAQSAIDVVRNFLGALLGDALSIEEVRDDLTEVAHRNTRSHKRYLKALETVLAEEQEPDVLAQAVGWYGNWVLDDPSDAGARAFLEELAEMLRQVIAEGDEAIRQRRRGTAP